MRLTETLSGYDKQFMLQGGPVSFMKSMIRQGDTFFDEVKRADRAYFLRSGNKTISPLYEEFLNSEYIIPKFYPFGYEQLTNCTEPIILKDYEFIKLNLPNRQYFAVFTCLDSNEIEIRSLIFNQSANYNDIIALAPETVSVIIQIGYKGRGGVDYNTLNKSDFVRCYAFDFEGAITDIVRHKYITKWENVYNALTTVVNPQDDYSIKKALSNTNTNTKSKTDKMSYGKTDTLSFTNRYDEKVLSSSTNKDFDSTKNSTTEREYQKSFVDRQDSESIVENHTHEIEQDTDTNTRTYDKYVEHTESTDSTSTKEKTSVSNNFSNQDYSWGFNSQTGVATDKQINNDENVTIRNAEDNNILVDSSSNKDIDGKIIDTRGRELRENNQANDSKVMSYTGVEKNDNIGRDNDVISSTEIIDNDETDTTRYNGNEAHSLSGEDTQTINESNSNTNEQNVDEYGFKNNPTENLQKALDFRLKNIFIDIIYSDIDSIVTIPIYL